MKRQKIPPSGGAGCCQSADSDFMQSLSYTGVASTASLSLVHYDLMDSCFMNKCISSNLQLVEDNHLPSFISYTHLN